MNTLISFGHKMIFPVSDRLTLNGKPNQAIINHPRFRFSFWISWIYQQEKITRFFACFHGNRNHLVFRWSIKLSIKRKDGQTLYKIVREFLKKNFEEFSRKFQGNGPIWYAFTAQYHRRLRNGENLGMEQIHTKHRRVS